MSYNFLHLSIQELLAGFYMATELSDDEQVSKFNELLGKSRFTAVFKFYAAITKLKTPGIKDVVIRAAFHYNDCAYFHDADTDDYVDRTPLVSLFHCLHEAQDPSLFQSVAHELKYRFEFSMITLTPSDCLCIGRFLSYICQIATDKVEVELSECSVDDQGCKYLTSGLCKNPGFPDGAVTTPLTLDISYNAITHFGLGLLLSVDCIENLQLVVIECDGQLKGIITIIIIIMQFYIILLVIA